MEQKVVELKRLNLKDDRELLSPPWIGQPLYQCATAVTVFGFVPHADLDIEVNGSVVETVTAGFPEPVGGPCPSPPRSSRAGRCGHASGAAVSSAPGRCHR